MAVHIPFGSAARTASATSDNLSLAPDRPLRAQLDVTDASGTGPTLDVVIEGSEDGGSTFATIGVFAQAIGVTRESIAIAAPIPPIIRARATIGGSTPSFTFEVRIRQ